MQLYILEYVSGKWAGLIVSSWDIREAGLTASACDIWKLMGLTACSWDIWKLMGLTVCS